MACILAHTIKFITHHLKVHNFHRSFQSSSDFYTKLIENYTQNQDLQQGRTLHAHLTINGLTCLTHFASKLIIFYSECKQFCIARKLFEKIPKSNLRRWIVLIGAYARNGCHQEAMDVFFDFQREGQKVNKYVTPSVLKACANLSDLRTGEVLHAVALKYEFEDDAFVISALIDMYSKCRNVEKAKRVFDRTVDKDLVALNALLSGYVQRGSVKEALHLVDEMKRVGVKPNVVTWNTLISGFAQAGEEAAVDQIFGMMRCDGVEPDVVSWTSVISGLVQNNLNNEAFRTFRKLLDSGLCPSTATISCLLPACATVADLRRGKEMHGFAAVRGMENDVFVKSALVDMYAKCGFIYEARALFSKMSERNTVTWNSMIFGYANHGCCNQAIELFNQMVREEERKLDHLTFTAALTACNHAGMVQLGHDFFHMMQKKYGIKPRQEHYACMVDLLGKAGKLAEAYSLIQMMQIEPDQFVWGALLGACRQHGNVELAEIAAKQLVKLEPESAGSSLLMSNIYADTNKWGNAAKVKKMIKRRKLRKFPGCSWIDVT